MIGTRLGNWGALGVALIAICFLALPAAASADGTPDLSLTKEAPDRVLYGDTSTVTLTASNPAGQPTGYNLSFRDVLPAGISYVPGSAPGSVGQPQVLANSPGTGQTTLIWSNVSDLTANSEFAFTYEVEHDPSVLSVGDTYQNQAGAYINCDPRYVPDFDATGVPVQTGGSPDCSGTPAEESYTGSATASADTLITAIKLEKSEPSPEDELLRGVHEHQTVYTLEVTNNSINPTNGVDLEDYIPAGLEFLACGQTDNTTDAPTNPGSAQEYPGSGPIDQGGAAPPGCVAPDLVETVSNPAGLPAGVYTHVVWSNVADLTPGQVFELRYVAAIPLRANTLTWTGAEPTPASGQQAANLDNNSGPETAEDGGSEPHYENFARAGGGYQDGSPGGIDVDDEDSEVVIAEDLRILKSHNNDVLTPGAITEWTLNIATSEYRFADDVVVTDTLGDGYCPLGSTNLEQTPPASEAECDPVGGQVPTSDYTSATENTNGTWTLIWDESTFSQLERIEPSSEVEITFPTRTRTHYQENFTDQAPILTRDTARNDVEVEGIDWIICAPGDPSPTLPGTCAAGAAKIDADEPDGTLDDDVSEAEQEAVGATIDKQVDSAPNTNDCLNGTYVNGPAPEARPGDTVCYRLRMDFPTAVDSGDVSVTDFIPPGTTYVAGSTQLTANNTVTIATPGAPEPVVDGQRLDWPLDDGGDVVGASQVFELVIKVEVGRLPASSDGDILDNLQKAVFSNTAGETFPLRDAVGFELIQPELSLVKGVRQVNAGPVNGPNVDGVTVAPGDDVSYRVDVTNNGSLEASSSEIWDELPPGITCANVNAASISNGGACNATEDRIEWNGVAVAAGASVSLTYTVAIPEGFAPTQSLINHAGVREYESPSGTGPYTHIPADNIDPTQNPSANAPAADDPSNVLITNVGITKARTTEINEPGNALANQATIGEEIDYTVTTTIPAGTTLYGADTRLVDNIGTRHTLVGTPTATLDTDGAGPGAPVALPTAGLTLSVVGTTIRIDFPDPYTNAIGSGNDVIELQFTAKVADVFPANYAQGTTTQRAVPNTGQLFWASADGTVRNRSASTSTEVVEPNVAVTKTNDAVGPLSPGDEVTYTVNASNGSGARVSTAHDPEVVDHVPVGLTPVNGGTPVADGGTVDPDGGVWDETARTITWTLAALAPGDSTELTYDATVDPGAVGAGGLTNIADLTVTSLPDGPDDDGERTSTSTGNPPGYAAQAQSSVTLISGAVIKASTPNQRTIGDVITHTVTVTIPPQIENFDATVVDDLPDGMVFDEYVSAQCTAGCSPGPSDITPATLTPTDLGGGQTRIGWFFGDLAPAPQQRTVELVYRTHVADQYDGGTDVVAGDSLVNEATFAFNLTNKVVSPPTSPPDPSTFDEERTDDAATTVIEPLLVIDKAVSGDPDADDARDAQPGDDFTYTLTITNNGDAPAYDVVVGDQPDTELTNVLVPTGPDYTVTDDWSAADPDIVWLIPGPIPANGTIELTYTADLVPSAQLSDLDVATNTADINEYFGVPVNERNTNGFDYRTYTDVDSDTVDVTIHIPDLELVKTTGAAGFPDSAPAETETAFPWRIVVTNPNAGSSLLGVDVTDVLPQNWSYVPNSAQVTGTGTLTPGGQVEPAISGGELRWQNVADLGGAQTVVIDFEAIPESAAALDPGIGVPHVNDADAVGEDTSGAQGSADGPYADEDPAEALLAAPQIDLAITKTADDPVAVAGTQTSWTMVVQNNGPKTAPAATVTDTIPAGLTYVSATPDQGTCQYSPVTLDCALGELANGDQVEIELVTEVDPSFAGQTITNQATVSDPAGDDTDPTNDTDEDSIVPAASADVGITKRLERELLVGRTATYVLGVTNHGASDASAVTVTDELPASLAVESVDGPNCSVSGQRVECALGTLKPGESRTIRIVARVNAVDAAGVVNTATVDSTTPDPKPENNEASTTNTPGNADLAIAKKGPDKLKSGEAFAYLLTVTNVGTVASGGTVSVVDTLPGALKPLSAAGPGWSCAIAKQAVTCERPDALAPGAEFPHIRVRAKLSDGTKATKVRNVATVSLPADPNPANDSDRHTGEVDAGDLRGEGGGDDERSCTRAKLSAVPAMVFVGESVKLKLFLEARSGRAIKGEKVKLRHKPGGETDADRTNRRGIAKFKVEAESTRDRWIAKAKKCRAKERIEAEPSPVCRAEAGDPESADEQPEAVDPRSGEEPGAAGPPSRRC